MTAAREIHPDLLASASEIARGLEGLAGHHDRSERAGHQLAHQMLGIAAVVLVALPAGPRGLAGRDHLAADPRRRGRAIEPEPGRAGLIVDLTRCRHRLSKLLLRHGRVWDAPTWTQTHERWLDAQRFEHVNTELAYLDNLAACRGLLARRTALDERLSHIAREAEFWPLVSRLRAFRGIDTLSALILVLEIGDFARFRRAVQLPSWLGLVPSRQQSGESDTHGPITKTGSRYARRILVEAAWHYSRRPRTGRVLARRQEGLPDHVLQIAWRAQHRLHRVHRRMRARGKPDNVATVAVARELAGFLWAAATAP